MCDLPWRSRLFGPRLIACPSRDEVPTEDALGDDSPSAVYGVYFSFANIATESELGRALRALRERVGATRLRVVQVALWTHTDVALDADECRATFERDVATVPWHAIPFDLVEPKRRLAQKYRIKVGAPVLVLIKSGGVEISRPSKDMLEDHEGFPWTPRPLEQILAGVPLERCGRWGDAEGGEAPRAETPSTSYADLPAGCVRAFYFAAHWCPPCKAFTPQLAETYSLVRRRGHDFQVIFVSSDRSQESYLKETNDMPWLSIGWNHSSVRKELASALAVQGIPALRLITHEGATPIEARQHVAGDPDGLNFPWKPGPINILTERYLNKLQEHPAIILFIDGEDNELQFAESVLYPVAESYYEEYSILHPGFYPCQMTPEEDTMDFEYAFSEKALSTSMKKRRHLHFLIAIDTEISDMLRDHIGLDDAVPLLAVVDFPKSKMAVMQYGAEITADSVQNFVDNYQSGQLEFQSLQSFIGENLKENCDSV